MTPFRAMHGPATRRRYSERPSNCERRSFSHQNSEGPEEPSTAPNGRDGTLARIEALLFLADEPLPLRRIADAAGLTDVKEARRAIDRLRDLLAADLSAFGIEELAGGYQLLTLPEFHPWLTRLRRTGHEVRLSAAAMETLAVIAYKQPIMRADVEAIRGVSCGEIIRTLLEKGLIKVAGRHDSLGRPQLYGTTKKFLQNFGLNTLNDLPDVESLRNPG